MPPRELDPGSDAGDLRIAVAVSEFNQPVSEGLLQGALEALAGGGVSDVTVVGVPGAFELPLACKELAVAGYDAVVALGAVIEGETDHYEFIAAETARGLMEVNLTAGVPVAFGVLTVREAQHAIVRSNAGPDNKGAEAAHAAIAAALAGRAIRASRQR